MDETEALVNARSDSHEPRCQRVPHVLEDNRLCSTGAVLPSQLPGGAFERACA